MKKITLLSVTFLLIVFVAKSQTNIQTHYEVAKSRQYPLLTIENFTRDNIGHTYFFMDMIFQKKSPTTAYFEIAREFNLETPYSIHIEYNGGLKYDTVSYRINNSYLLGVTYLYENKKFNITLTPMFKYIVGNYDPYGFQVTSVWNWNICDKFKFNGFVDFWQDNGTGVILHTEPALWYNFNKTFSIGSEIEICYKTYNKTIIYPTIALKYTL